MIPLKDRNPTSRLAIVSVVLIVVNVVVHLLVTGSTDGTEVITVQDRQVQINSADRFVFEFAAIPCEIVQGRPLEADELVDAFAGPGDRCDEPPITSEVFGDKRVWLAVVFSMFLHADWFHLGFNMLFLWIFGNNIEDHLGPVRYVAFYLLAGVAASAAHIGLQPDSTIPVIGASGAVAGVMGAYLVWFPNAPVRTLFFFVLIWLHDIRARWLLGFWFVTQFFTGSDSQVAWAAHVGGFVFGALVGLAIRVSAPLRRMVFVPRYRRMDRWDTTGGRGLAPPRW